jgi:CRISPR-associated protein Cas2
MTRATRASSRTPMEPALWVVTYDIADDRRRTRIAQLLEDYGVRVQFSVFECVLVPAQRRELASRLAALMDGALDSIAFYPLCRACRPRGERLGREAPRADPPYLLL